MAAMRRRLCNLRLPTPIYVAVQKERSGALAREGICHGPWIIFVIGDFLGTFGSAAAASRAVEANRKPRRSDLKKLGIDLAAFDKLGRF
ncbi:MULTISPECIES: hypothetical protein [unclassified Mesorhizobium]|uniref:hypothetical protein n=1 Tax=unclassified Mesorhizobium TaxID=325217 RepID=UPI000FC9BDDC|nr:MULTISPECIES: hypothetical protein [unclassified Mesorhizobium]RUW00281.1 hypothetical protein EOA49_16050 [Mesorhizobium sp. M1A.F.Ca.IN.020.04.1.1]RUW14030.1 hypothetical protein EOA53_07555 [Mesorhizobium sp. M1A.F.Ca.IN.020.03.1.1]RWF73558.1 MAG: hypothetical protein EOQ34_08550 [Mesorhizobium sp.]RWG33949.1 MAG: hypothetical protein EOQ61_07165 [Mesorhizobium sp.]RWH13829.1 MAG: hypothetical protein EOQ74_12430 [Mesorhizobium sp.]